METECHQILNAFFKLKRAAAKQSTQWF
jgi:hypothetical protein